MKRLLALLLTALAFGAQAQTLVPVRNGGTGNTTSTAWSPVFTGITATGAFKLNLGPGTNGQVLTSAGAGAYPSWATPAAGTVTSVAVTTAAGFSCTVATATTTPNLTCALGAITPSSVSTGAVTSSTLTAAGIVYAGTAGLLTTDATNNTYDATNKILQVGSGSTTSAGIAIGYYGSSGFGALWTTARGTPSTSNYSIGLSATTMDLSATGTITLNVNGGPKLTLPGTAGQGSQVTAGTAASAVSAQTITQTWNYNTAALDGVKWTFTDTSSHANTNAFRIIGGAAGATNLFIFDKSGLLTTTAGFNTASAAVTFSGLASDAASTDSTVCVTSVTGVITKGSGTLGICLGTSSERYKIGIAPLREGLNEILSLRPKQFYMDAAHGDPSKLMYGFSAEDGIKVLPKLAGLDAGGRANNFDYLGIVPVLVNAVKELNAKIERITLQ